MDVHSSLVEVLDALAIVELVEYVPLVIAGEGPPDGLKQAVGEEMDVEIDDFFRELMHDARTEFQE
jgi:hypothetical protein